MRIAGEGRPGIVRAMLRPRRHPGLVALAAAAAVVAATAGGYVATSTRPPSAAVAGQSGARHGARAAPAAPDGLVASGAGGVAAGGTVGAGSGTSGSGVIACPMIPGVADATGDGAGLGSASLLFTRTTGDGVVIRAYRLASTPGCGCGPIPNPPTASPSSGSSSGSAPTAQAPPGTSLVSPEVSVELSTTAAVGQGVLLDAPAPSATATGSEAEPLANISDAFGIREGNPVWWIAAAVGPEVAVAQVTFADGSTDEMTPVDGVAVVAHQIETATAQGGDPYDVRGSLQLLDSSGAVINDVAFPEPSPPIALPSPVPGKSPQPLPLTPPVSVTTVPSPPGPANSMFVCPEIDAPSNSSAG